MSQLSQSFHLSRRKKSESDPTKKFIRELYSDLETIYVGQLSLSWEFLQWEYEKALEIWESDQWGERRFNEVAGEFQQFQVLLQRFIENEPFQGPRVENYVRNRYAVKNLLQVPVIREDSAKEKKKMRKRDSDEDAITSGMLVGILEESIRTIWRFIRADKDASNTTLKGVKENQTELQDPADSELVAEVRAELEKVNKLINVNCTQCCCLDGGNWCGIAEREEAEGDIEEWKLHIEEIEEAERARDGAVPVLLFTSGYEISVESAEHVEDNDGSTGLVS